MGNGSGWEFRGIATGIVSAVSWLLGGIDTLLEALVVAMVLDVVGGLLHAYYDGKLNSTKMWKGIVRKSTYFAIIIVGVMLDLTLFHAKPVARTLVISFLLVNEALSILEHAAAMGAPIPKVIIQKLERVREEYDAGDQQQQRSSSKDNQ